MNSTFYRDYTIVLLFGILGALGISHFLIKEHVPISFWIGLGLLAIVTPIIQDVLVKANGKRPQLFVAYFMGSLTGKFFLSAIVLVVVGLLDKPNLMYTALGYFIMYILFTAVELKHLLPLIRNSKH